MFQRLEVESRRDSQKLENFYYECIYALIRTADENPSVRSQLRHLNAKIVRIHANRMQDNIMYTDTVDNIPGETHTLYQIIRKHKRRSSRSV
jgi:hypothetical protein